MKKRYLLALSLVSIVALASCAGDPNPSSTSDNTSVSVPDYPSIKIVARQDSYQVERLGEVTVRFNVTGDATASKKVVFTIDNNDNGEGDQLVTYDDNALGDASTGGVSPSLKLTGNKKGTVTVTATSVANPTITASVTVTVVDRVPELSKVWANIISYKNYTLKTERIVSDDEKETVGTKDDTEDFSVTRATEKAITQHIFRDGKETLPSFLPKSSTAYIPIYGDKNSTDTTTGYTGVAIDKNGYAVYVNENINTGVMTPATTIIQNSFVGLVDSTNFAGRGTSATSPNEAGIFYGLQAINPNWFSAYTKASDNVYTIEGSDSDANSAFAESMLWGLLDPVGYIEYVSTLSSATYINIAAAITTTITATSNNTVEIEITRDNGVTVNNQTFQLDVKATLTDISTTTIAINGLDTLEASKPELASAMQLVVEAVGKDDYVFSRTESKQVGSSETDTVDLTRYYYYTPNYFFMYYDDTFVTNYNKYIDYAISQGATDSDTGLKITEADKMTSAEGIGFLKGTSGIYAFNYTGAVTTTGTDGTSTTTPASIAFEKNGQVTSTLTTDANGKVSGTSATTDFTDWVSALGVPAYLSTSSLFDTSKNDIYMLSTTSAKIFDDMPNFYDSSADKVFQDVVEVLYPGQSSSITRVASIAGVAPTVSTDKDNKSYVSGVELLAAFSPDATNYAKGRFYIIKGDFTNFGTAESANAVNADIQTLITSVTTAA
jgi:hypothetical protein